MSSTAPALPKITEAQRLRLAPGDALIIKLAFAPDQQQADQITGYVQRVLDRPDLRVLMIGPADDMYVVPADHVHAAPAGVQDAAEPADRRAHRRRGAETDDEPAGRPG